MIITTERGIPMEKFETCPVCKGSGREDHTHMREDGETVVERIPVNIAREPEGFVVI